MYVLFRLSLRVDFWDVLEDVRKISAQFAKPERGIQRIQEMYFDGWLSHFDAFGKARFASLINIEWSPVERLREPSQHVTVDTTVVAWYGTDIVSRLKLSVNG